MGWVLRSQSFSLKDADSQGTSTMGERVKLHPEAFAVCSLFLLTILMSASFQSFVEIPAVLGMMTGLGLLMVRTSLRAAERL
jgi:hypothetical protein